MISDANTSTSKPFYPSERCLFCDQVLWEMLTREVPFKGFEGLQVAWLVVEKQEVHTRTHAHTLESTFLNAFVSI